MTTAVDKLGTIRDALATNFGATSAFYIPHADEHGNEYLPACNERLAWVSGFTGSAGTGLITPSEAYVWTDGRYYLQAERELEPGWALMKAHSAPSVGAWATSNGITTLVASASTLSHAACLRLAKSLGQGCELTVISENWLDDAWKEDAHAPRPPPLLAPLRVMDESVAGESVESKVGRVVQCLGEEGYGGMVVTALDEVAWLTNTRGGDVQYNPVYASVAIVVCEPREVILFVDASRVGQDVRVHLEQGGVRVVDGVDAGNLEDTVTAALAELEARDVKLWLDGRSVSTAFARVLQVEPESRTSIVCALKAVKNSVELAGMRAAHVRDGVALVRFLKTLGERMARGDVLTEYEASSMVLEERERMDSFVSPSFETISSSGPNGAVIHYAPPPVGSRQLSPDEPYLCDSGGQYLDGTTDVTRVRVFNDPTPHMKRCYTRVLQGHIALDTVVFPPGTTGVTLDILARTGLWKDGLDYRHGTGHGVGHFLNVHEGPHLIANRTAPNNPALQVGMTVTNEPGYYEDGGFGFRIENVLIVTPAPVGGVGDDDDDSGWMAFESITLAPLERKLIDMELLQESEITWINAYHQRVLDGLVSSGLLAPDEVEWLTNACAAL